MTAADLPQPMPRFGPQFAGPPGPRRRRDEVPRRARGGRGRRHEGRGRGGRAPRPGRVRGAARGLHAGGRARPGRAARPGPGPPPGRPAARRPTSSASTASAGATWTPRAGRPRRRAAPYTFPMVTHFAIEPHAFMAAPDGDGIAVWSTIQHPNWLQKILAGVLGLPLSRVRVFAPDPGGGFGGKQHAEVRAARRLHGPAAGRPVPPRPDPRGDLPGGAPDVGRGPRADRASWPTARSPSRTSRPTTSSAPTSTSPTGS